ncbi:MAG: hypothetical protein PVH82_11145 [Desulfobacteraceae bacterium]|jgi:hypothetical protein
MKKILKFILIILFAFVALSICARPSGPYKSYFTPGPVQAIGNKNRLWIFLEFPRVVHHPKSSCSWDAPSVYPEGHFQEVLIFNRTGLLKRSRVSLESGVTFHPNISEIFAGHDGMYLRKGQSASYRRSIFRWKTDHFELLPFSASEQIFLSLGISENSRENYPKASNAFEALTVKNGWEKVFSETYAVESNFVWQGFKVSIDEMESTKDYFELAISFSSRRKRVEPILLRYDREYEEYKKRKKRTRQQAHRK